MKKTFLMLLVAIVLVANIGMIESSAASKFKTETDIHFQYITPSDRGVFYQLTNVWCDFNYEEEYYIGYIPGYAGYVSTTKRCVYGTALDVHPDYDGEVLWLSTIEYSSSLTQSFDTPYIVTPNNVIYPTGVNNCMAAYQTTGYTLFGTGQKGIAMFHVQVIGAMYPMRQHTIEILF